MTEKLTESAIFRPMYLTIPDGQYKNHWTTSTLILLVFAAGLIACAGKNNAESAETEKPQTGVSSAPTSITCWAYSQDDDLIGLTLTMTGQQVSGKLTYTVFDRERTSGDISGVMRGDTIIADYAHFAQGKPIVQEVVFLFRNNAYVEGLGPTVVKDGKVVFQDRSALTFNQDRPLASVPCHR